MASNPFRKGWRYFKALLGYKIDQYADVRVQLQQSMQEVQERHEELLQRAAKIIGGQSQIEMKLSRKVEEQRNLELAIEHATERADEIRKENPDKAADYDKLAAQLAQNLVTVDSSLESLKEMHAQSVLAASSARQAVENNAMIVQQQLAERDKYMSQIEQAEMAETLSKSMESMSAISSNGDTPSLDDIRNKIESKFATANARAELASNSVEARMMDIKQLTMSDAATKRLEAIRNRKELEA